MHLDSTGVHLLAGGIGGTTGAVLTCPLEVVKTRLQSSVATFHKPQWPGPGVPQSLYVPQPAHVARYSTCTSLPTNTSSVAQPSNTRTSLGLYRCLSYIVQEEGTRALFKGLGPNLVGVAPSRAIYFCSYAHAKKFFNTVMPAETPLVHICSASCAGFTASTLTNPIWYIKTRLQLDQKRLGSLTTGECIRQTYTSLGIRGFYRGITASYYGISETVIHFVIYEAIKAKLREAKAQKGQGLGGEKTTMDFVEFMVAGAMSKTVATCVAYPHEVARTRLRQEGSKYTGFWQTLGLVLKEEGTAGLYRGLATQLVRQIPNTAIMMSTYELVVYLLSKDTGVDSEEA